MEQFIRYVLGEAGVIVRAPLVFAAAVLILVGLAWMAMDWRYSGVIANRDSEISSLRTQRDEYKEKLAGATPEQAAQRIAGLEGRLKELKDTIDGLKDAISKLTKPLSKDIAATQARDPDAIYQSDLAVGHVVGARITLNQGQVYLDQIENAANLDKSKTFEYRDYVLRLGRADSYIGMLVGPSGVATNVYQHAVAEIVGRVGSGR
jgi:hypothetical protein